MGRVCQRWDSVTPDEPCEHEALHIATYEDGEVRYLCDEHAPEALEAGVDVCPDAKQRAYREELAGRETAFDEVYPRLRPLANAVAAPPTFPIPIRRAR